MTLMSRNRFSLDRRPLWVALGALGIGLAVAGCSHDTGAAPGTDGAAIPSPSAQQASAPPDQTTAPTPTRQSAGGAGETSKDGQVKAYKVSDSSNGQGADPNGLAPTPVDVGASTQSPARTALMQLAEGPNSPLPTGTKLLGVKIEPKTGMAVVDFSREFKTNFAGGDEREAQAINSVLKTMGQFPNVTKVQILVAGKKIDTLGGGEEIDQPLPTPQASDKMAKGGGA